MKKIAITPFLILAFYITNAQRFFVDKTSDGYESAIINRLIEKNHKVTNIKDSADYIITCMYGKTGIGTAKAYITISNKKGDIIAKSKEVKSNSNAFNGYESSSKRAVEKIAKDYLDDMVEKLRI